MDSTPSGSPAGYTIDRPQRNNGQKVGFGCPPSGDIGDIRGPPRPTNSCIRMVTETPDQVRASLAKWEEGQKLGGGYFQAKERMAKEIDSMATPLSLEPQVNGSVQLVNGHPTASPGEEVGGGPLSLDALNSPNDYGYSLRNFTTCDPVDDSSFLARIPIGVYMGPGYVRDIPPTSGLQKGATGEEMGQGGRRERGREDFELGGTVDTPSCE
ncbi:hypothetical protein C7212DRAFT_344522 [Tuber magnatum]|uniref:Uncharacterized protein n=1 Tax=Tuber magnatum TaxID=42249 RepID=A0A317SNT2_9PEZI|nr:hypothetical protein C7212DRAFT_344522 [Tuber magnatum]